MLGTFWHSWCVLAIGFNSAHHSSWQLQSNKVTSQFRSPDGILMHHFPTWNISHHLIQGRFWNQCDCRRWGICSLRNREPVSANEQGDIDQKSIAWLTALGNVKNCRWKLAQFKRSPRPQSWFEALKVNLCLSIMGGFFVLHRGKLFFENLHAGCLI